MDNATYAAHKIADLLRQIEQQAQYLDAPKAAILNRTSLDRETMAKSLEASAPFVPCTEDEKEAIWDEHVDCASDLSRRDIAELLLEGWTEADWRMHHDQQREMDAEDASDED